MRCISEKAHTHRRVVLNFPVPGGFETDVPAIASWFAEHPPEDARVKTQ